MLAAPTPTFIGMDSRSRRLRLADLVADHPDLRLVGHAPVDHSCLRATIARRPDVLVLAPMAGRGGEAGQLVAGVRRGSPITAILAIAAEEDRPVADPAGEATADRVLADPASLDQVMRAVLDLARARQVMETPAARRDVRRRPPPS